MIFIIYFFPCVNTLPINKIIMSFNYYSDYIIGYLSDS